MANTVSSNAYPVSVSLKQWATIVTLSTLTLGLTACGNQKQQSTVTNSDGSVTTIDNKDVQLLNVSYDISRDFYKDYNPLFVKHYNCLLYTSPSPRDVEESRMPSSA